MTIKKVTAPFIINGKEHTLQTTTMLLLAKTATEAASILLKCVSKITGMPDISFKVCECYFLYTANKI